MQVNVSYRRMCEHPQSKNVKDKCANGTVPYRYICEPSQSKNVNDKVIHATCMHIRGNTMHNTVYQRAMLILMLYTNRHAPWTYEHQDVDTKCAILNGSAKIGCLSVIMCHNCTTALKSKELWTPKVKCDIYKLMNS